MSKPTSEMFKIFLRNSMMLTHKQRKVNYALQKKIEEIKLLFKKKEIQVERKLENGKTEDRALPIKTNLKNSAFQHFKLPVYKYKVHADPSSSIRKGFDRVKNNEISHVVNQSKKITNELILEGVEYNRLMRTLKELGIDIAELEDEDLSIISYPNFSIETPVRQKPSPLKKSRSHQPLRINSQQEAKDIDDSMPSPGLSKISPQESLVLLQTSKKATTTFEVNKTTFSDGKISQKSRTPQLLGKNWLDKSPLPLVVEESKSKAKRPNNPSDPNSRLDRILGDLKKAVKNQDKNAPKQIMDLSSQKMELDQTISHTKSFQKNQNLSRSQVSLKPMKDRSTSFENNRSQRSLESNTTPSHLRMNNPNVQIPLKGQTIFKPNPRKMPRHPFERPNDASPLKEKINRENSLLNETKTKELNNEKYSASEENSYLKKEKFSEKQFGEEENFDEIPFPGSEERKLNDLEAVMEIKSENREGTPNFRSSTSQLPSESDRDSIETNHHNRKSIQKQETKNKSDFSKVKFQNESSFEKLNSKAFTAEANIISNKASQEYVPEIESPSHFVGQIKSNGQGYSSANISDKYLFEVRTDPKIAADLQDLREISKNIPFESNNNFDSQSSPQTDRAKDVFAEESHDDTGIKQIAGASLLSPFNSNLKLSQIGQHTSGEKIGSEFHKDTNRQSSVKTSQIFRASQEFEGYRGAKKSLDQISENQLDEKTHKKMSIEPVEDFEHKGLEKNKEKSRGLSFRLGDYGDQESHRSKESEQKFKSSEHQTDKIQIEAEHSITPSNENEPRKTKENDKQRNISHDEASNENGQEIYIKIDDYLEENTDSKFENDLKAKTSVKNELGIKNIDFEGSISDNVKLEKDISEHVSDNHVLQKQARGMNFEPLDNNDDKVPQNHNDIIEKQKQDKLLLKIGSYPDSFQDRQTKSKQDLENRDEEKNFSEKSLDQNNRHDNVFPSKDSDFEKLDNNDHQLNEQTKRNRAFEDIGEDRKKEGNVGKTMSFIDGRDSEELLKKESNDRKSVDKTPLKLKIGEYPEGQKHLNDQIGQSNDVLLDKEKKKLLNFDPNYNQSDQSDEDKDQKEKAIKAKELLLKMGNYGNEDQTTNKTILGVNEEEEVKQRNKSKMNIDPNLDNEEADFEKRSNDEKQGPSHPKGMSFKMGNYPKNVDDPKSSVEQIRENNLKDHQKKNLEFLPSSQFENSQIANFDRFEADNNFKDIERSNEVNQNEGKKPDFKIEGVLDEAIPVRTSSTMKFLPDSQSQNSPTDKNTESSIDDHNPQNFQKMNLKIGKYSDKQNHPHGEIENLEEGKVTAKDIKNMNFTPEDINEESQQINSKKSIDLINQNKLPNTTTDPLNVLNNHHGELERNFEYKVNEKNKSMMKVDPGSQEDIQETKEVFDIAEKGQNRFPSRGMSLKMGDYPNDAKSPHGTTEQIEEGRVKLGKSKTLNFEPMDNLDQQSNPDKNISAEKKSAELYQGRPSKFGKHEMSDNKLDDEKSKSYVNENDILEVMNSNTNEDSFIDNNNSKKTPATKKRETDNLANDYDEKDKQEIYTDESSNKRLSKDQFMNFDKSEADNQSFGRSSELSQITDEQRKAREKKKMSFAVDDGVDLPEQNNSQPNQEETNRLSLRRSSLNNRYNRQLYPGLKPYFDKEGIEETKSKDEADDKTPRNNDMHNNEFNEAENQLINEKFSFNRADNQPSKDSDEVEKQLINKKISFNRADNQPSKDSDEVEKQLINEKFSFNGVNNHTNKASEEIGKQPLNEKLSFNDADTNSIKRSHEIEKQKDNEELKSNKADILSQKESLEDEKQLINEKFSFNGAETHTNKESNECQNQLIKEKISFNGADPHTNKESNEERSDLITEKFSFNGADVHSVKDSNEINKKPNTQKLSFNGADNNSDHTSKQLDEKDLMNFNSQNLNHQDKSETNIPLDNEEDLPPPPLEISSPLGETELSPPILDNFSHLSETELPPPILDNSSQNIQTNNVEADYLKNPSEDKYSKNQKDLKTAPQRSRINSIPNSSNASPLTEKSSTHFEKPLELQRSESPPSLLNESKVDPTLTQSIEGTQPRLSGNFGSLGRSNGAALESTHVRPSGNGNVFLDSSKVSAEMPSNSNRIVSVPAIEPYDESENRKSDMSQASRLYNKNRSRKTLSPRTSFTVAEERPSLSGAKGRMTRGAGRLRRSQIPTRWLAAEKDYTHEHLKISRLNSLEGLYFDENQDHIPILETGALSANDRSLGINYKPYQNPRKRSNIETSETDSPLKADTILKGSPSFIEDQGNQILDENWSFDSLEQEFNFEETEQQGDASPGRRSLLDQRVVDTERSIFLDKQTPKQMEVENKELLLSHKPDEDTGGDHLSDSFWTRYSGLNRGETGELGRWIERCPMGSYPPVRTFASRRNSLDRLERTTASLEFFD